MSIDKHIDALQRHMPEVMGPPTTTPSPWPVFDPETQERYPVVPEMIQSPHDAEEFAAEDLDIPEPIILPDTDMRTTEFPITNLQGIFEELNGSIGPGVGPPPGRGTSQQFPGVTVASTQTSPIQTLPGTTPSAALLPIPYDVEAWYQPFHFFPKDWGIFIKQDALDRIGHALFRIALGGGGSPSRRLLSDCRRAAFLILFKHEFFHHKVECFATRMEVFMRCPAYQPQFHAPHWLLEEALANAHAFAETDILSGRKKNALVQEARVAARCYQLLDFRCAPPGYRDAVYFLKKKPFGQGSQFLNERIRVWASPSGPVCHPDVWEPATYRDAPWARINIPCYVVVDKAGVRRRPMRFRAWQRRELEKLYKIHGVFPSDGRGPHSTLRDDQGNTFPPLPRHRQISPGVARKIYKSLGLTEDEAISKIANA